MTISELTSSPTFRKNYQLIIAQAEQAKITWYPKGADAISEITVRRLRNHLAKVKTNQSRLLAWAGRVRPEGELREITRYIYNQYRNEITRVEKVIEEVSRMLADSLENIDQEEIPF